MFMEKITGPGSNFITDVCFGLTKVQSLYAHKQYLKMKQACSQIIVTYRGSS